MRNRSSALLGSAAAVLLAIPLLAQEDPFIWLENVEGERALEWVEAQNAETMAELGAHPAFTGLYDDVLGILTAQDRVAFPSTRGDVVYNFWTDAEHPRGYYRRTSMDDYLSGDPTWETVLDVDALAEAEGVPWAYGGMNCLAPENRLCMVSLARGGSDAVEIREFDLEEARFIEGGFFVPEAKTSLGWVDENTLLVSTDFGPGSLTTSGYARTARLWERGTPLTEAELVFEGAETDVATFTGSLETRSGNVSAVYHRPSFFDGTMYLFRDGELQALDVPTDADPGLVGDDLVVYVRDAWEVGGRTFDTGSVIAMNLEAFLAGERDFDVVVAPGGRQTVQGTAPAGDVLLVSMLDNVQGQLWKYRRAGGEWVGEQVEVPPMGSVGLVDVDLHSDRFFFTYSSFTQPGTLYMHSNGDIREVRRSPARFDAADFDIQQHFATSTDGTQVPYFVVSKTGTELNGLNPTLLSAYGGFEIPRVSSYSSTVGKAWMERGGVYVVANIRGGGEFGPSWHRSGLRENRQRVYDDFIAVTEDLIARGISSPEHLGIQGGSNGGLLVGVAMTQRPELYDAVVVQVPLLDMKRYNKLLAGASWMAEYGNPDIPEEWEYISRYSPYQNVHEGVEYPRALFTTTTRDDRVHPGHARKMAAKMISQGHPIYYFENTEGGHGSGVTPEQQARMIALTYAYLWKQLGPEGRPIS